MMWYLQMKIRVLKNFKKQVTKVTFERNWVIANSLKAYLGLNIL